MFNNELERVPKTIFERGFFNCNICKDILKTPIILVGYFGNICSTCRIVNLHKIGIPNTVLDMVLHNYIFPCKYKLHGCEEWIEYSLLIQHQQECSFKEKACLLKTCNWVGSTENLITHWLETHTNKIISMNDNVFKCQFKLESSLPPYVLLRKSINEIYILKLFYFHGELNAILYNTSVDTINYSIKFESYTKKNCLIECISVPFSKIYENIEDEKVLSCDINLLIEVLHLNEFNNVVSLILTLETEKINYNELIKEMKCCFCSAVLRSPIYQCNKGHSICLRCRKFMYCHICSAKLGDIRNYALETLMDNVNFPCKYRDIGCMDLIRGRSLSTHEENCTFKDNVML